MTIVQNEPNPYTLAVDPAEQYVYVSLKGSTLTNVRIQANNGAIHDSQSL